jgi:hypothetical protein
MLKLKKIISLIIMKNIDDNTNILETDDGDVIEIKGEINVHSINNIEEFIEIVKFNRSIKKVQIKFIDDILTSHINNLFLITDNLLNTFLRYVLNTFLRYVDTLFNDFDSSHFGLNEVDSKITIHPEIYNREKIYNIDTNRFVHLSNDSNDIKGYFVFKGGNVIKYWTLKKYI